MLKNVIKIHKKYFSNNTTLLRKRLYCQIIRYRREVIENESILLSQDRMEEF